MGALLNIIGALCVAVTLAMLSVSVITRKEPVVVLTAGALALIFALVAIAMFVMGASYGHR